MKEYNLIVVGGGISGITAALAALENGIKNVLILEREGILGGVINQCLHVGFGKELLKANLTGPEYINFFVNRLKEYDVDINIKLGATVLNIDSNKVVTYVSPDDGVVKIQGKAIILAMGCREKYTGNIDIPTDKFTGIYTVGNAHRTITTEGYMPGKRPVIVANSKWGCIVAKRFTIEGAKVEALIIEETEDFSYNEDIKNILEDFGIPILINTKVIGAIGKERIEKVNVMNTETEEVFSIECDSLILSVGYFPEKDILKGLNISFDEETKGIQVTNHETSVKGIFACGNIIYGVNALNEKGVNGIAAGNAASNYIKSSL